MLKRTKQLNDIQNSLQHITDLLEGEEMKQLRADSEELKKIKELLTHVKFKIKESRVVENQSTGNVSVVVSYEMPRIVLTLDDSGQPNKDEFFYSTNMLNMISLEDMSKFLDVLKNAQARIKKQ